MEEQGEGTPNGAVSEAYDPTEGSSVDPTPAFEQRPPPSSTPTLSAPEEASETALTTSKEDIVAASPGIAIEDKFKVQMEVNLEQDAIQGTEEIEEEVEEEDDLDGEEDASPDEVDEEQIIAMNKFDLEGAVKPNKEDDKESVISDVDPIGSVVSKEKPEVTTEDVVPSVKTEAPFEEGEDESMQSSPCPQDDDPISPPEGFDPIDDVLEPDFIALPSIRKAPSLSASSTSSSSGSSGGDTVRMVGLDPVTGDSIHSGRMTDDSLNSTRDDIKEQKFAKETPPKLPYSKQPATPLHDDDDAEELALLRSDPFQRDNQNTEQDPELITNGKKPEPTVRKQNPVRNIVPKKQPLIPREVHISKDQGPGYLMDDLLEKESRKTGVKLGLLDPDSAFESEGIDEDSPNEDFIERVKRMAALDKVSPFSDYSMCKCTLQQTKARSCCMRASTSNQPERNND